MKKHLIATIAIAIVTILLLVACGGTVDSSPSSIVAPESEQPSSAPTAVADGDMPKQSKAEDLCVTFVDSDGDTFPLGYADLYYRFYYSAQKSAVLVRSWEQPSEIDGHYLMNFFVAQSNWNQTTYDSDIVFLPQQIVEDYLKMYFDIESAQIRQSEMYYKPEMEAYLLPMYPQENNSIITDATINGNILTIYYETYNPFKENNPVSRQGHVTIAINPDANLKIWKYISNEITYDADPMSWPTPP